MSCPIGYGEKEGCMRFEVEIKEIVEKVNTYVIEVESEEEGENIAISLEDDVEDARHPDHITDAFRKAGTKVIEMVEGAEDVEYELF